jgi:uncharacterized protein YcbK (DUF882 family)
VNLGSIRVSSRVSSRALWTTLAVGIAAAVAALPMAHPAKPAAIEPFSALASDHIDAGASLNAFGTSRELRLRFALPGTNVEFPLEVSGDPSKLSYQWVSIDDSTADRTERPVIGSSFVVPAAPGFYHLAIVRGTEREVIPDPTLAVMVPFSQKVGSTLNGYHIGTYLAEKFSRHTDHPVGFLQVREADVNLKVSTHLRLADFITHDSQGAVWPKYVALNPRLLDKLELVLTTVGAHARLSRPDEMPTDVAFDVHSGFRTPAHNRGVWRSASDSRHQYGDAADVAIDADGDGRVTLKDELLVARAVDQVETEHPDLVGGLGLYTSRHYRTPYVHIDARGKRSRWTG